MASPRDRRGGDTVAMRVLVVEDESKMARLLERGLREEGCIVDVVSTGVDAQWLATSTTLDVIVLDLALPDIDGIEVCRRLRAADVWTPVLMLTARDAIGDRIAGLDAGADDYLVKPFAFGELLARLRALARRDLGPRPTVVSVGDVTLDPASRRVWRGDTELALTAKEFALLSLFLRHPGEVLTRDRLLEQVWDFAFEQRSNVLDVHIRGLREKVDRPFGRDSVQTLRGVGYRWKQDA
ncbi:MAG: two-component system, OmpR family, response regulator [Frankiaceae bacterium]|nr:two-component system, OmpR family, response regulator [Frankiaceae bacterium]